MKQYEKKGYLSSDFRIFHLTDNSIPELEFHYHEFDKITILIHGNVDYTIEGKTYSLEPYDIVLVQHNEIHRPIVDPALPYERFVIYISPNFLKSYHSETYRLNDCFYKVSALHSHVLRVPVPQKNIIFQTLWRLQNSFSSCGYANELYQQLLFLEFMIHLNRLVQNKDIYFLDSAVYNKKITDILHYITANLSASLSIDELSAKFYLSKYYMMRLFKSETGYSISNYISQKRLLHAKQQILQGTPVMEACFNCGFHDYSTFSRAYRKCFNESPRQTLSSKSSPELEDGLAGYNTYLE